MFGKLFRRSLILGVLLGLAIGSTMLATNLDVTLETIEDVFFTSHTIHTSEKTDSMVYLENYSCTINAGPNDTTKDIIDDAKECARLHEEVNNPNGV